jgi:hypothetical protein
MRASLLAVAAAAGVAAARAAVEAPPPGRVTFVSGEATRSREGKTERLALGTPVWENDTVETQKRTRLEITLRDQSLVRVGPLSRVVLSGAVFGRSLDERKVAARLLVGDMWAKVAKAVGGDSRFEVQTANAVAGVRGTTFRVDAKADRSVVVKVYAGTVAVAGGGPIPRPVHGGAEPGGEPPAAPAPLPSPERKPGRVRVPGPREVTREQWERIVGAMMQVKVAADGTPAQPEPFQLADAKADEFEAWNRERDGDQ